MIPLGTLWKKATFQQKFLASVPSCPQFADRMMRSWLLVLGLCANAILLVSGFSVASIRPSRLCRQASGNFVFHASSQDEEEFVRVPRRRRRGRLFDDEESEEAFYDRVERNIYGDDEFDDVDLVDEDDDDDDDSDDEEEYGMFSDVLIDNPILDSIDPDGAAERFPELARDPRFWFDMILFIAFLDLLSTIGPQNYFPDIPYYV